MANSNLKNPNSKQYKKIIESGKLEKYYLFTGDENAEKENFIQLINKAYFKGQPVDSHQVSRFNIEYEDLMAAAEYCINESIFYQKRICIINNIDSISAKDSQRVSLLQNIIEEKSESILLILLSAANKVPASIKPKNRDKIQTIQFWKMFENELEAHIVATLKKAGKFIEKSAVIKIIQCIGRDLKGIENAITRILDGCENQNVTEKDVIELIADEKQILVFDFVNSLYSFKKDSYELLKKVLDSGVHELVILHFIRKEAESLEKYFQLQKNGIDQGEIVSMLKISRPAIQGFIERVSFYNAKRVKKIFTLIYKAEYQLKSYSLSKSLLSNPLLDLIYEFNK